MRIDSRELREYDIWERINIRRFLKCIGKGDHYFYGKKKCMEYVQ